MSNHRISKIYHGIQVVIGLPDLVEKAKNGHKNAFMQLIENSRQQMYKTAYLKLGNEQDALDAVQETLVKAFINIRNLKHNEFFKTWLIRILLNECHNIRSYRRKIIPIDKEMLESGCKGELNENPDSNAEMLMMFGRLQDIYRDVVDLRYNHDLKLEEIAEVLKIPAGTVKSRLNTAHKLLRKEYQDREVSS